MNGKTILALAGLGMLMHVPAVMAQATSLKPVMTLEGYVGKVLIEMPSGKRIAARTGMTLPEGSTLMVLEKGSAKAVYARTNCKAAYKQNTIVHVKDAAQCPGGVSVISGDKYSKFNTAANNGTGCCITRTIPVAPVTVANSAANAAALAAVPATTVSGFALSAFNSLPLLAGAAGIAGMASLIGSDGSSNTPVSR